MLGKILFGLGAGLMTLVAICFRRGTQPALPSFPGEDLRRRTATAASRLAALEPSTRAFARAIISWARERGIPAYLGLTYRGAEEEVDPDTTALAPGAFGWHSVGRAFHLDIRENDGKFDRSAYAIVGAEVRRRGGAWLGDRTMISRSGKPFLDLAHFEYHPGFKKLVQYRGTALAKKELAAAEQRAAGTAS